VAEGTAPVRCPTDRCQWAPRFCDITTVSCRCSMRWAGPATPRYRVGAIDDGGKYLTAGCA
jgi:hypothetical protein